MAVFYVTMVVVLLLAYAWVGYPLLLIWLAALSRKPQAGPGPAGFPVQGFLPRVGILFSAHNEEPVIRQRLENITALAYPQDKLRVYAGVDGSTDRTAAIAGEWASRHANVWVCVEPKQRGKIAMLKRLVRRAMEEAPQTPDTDRHAVPDILVFTDANTMFEPDALSVLIAPFADLRVGGVCGELVFHEAADGETGESGYWRIETGLKELESHLDSCLGANGAIYAVRRDLFWEQAPDDTIVDDFVLGMKVREQGYRVAYEPRARAHEELPAKVAHEWRRRVRIGAGAFQSLVLCRRCLLPRYGTFAWMFWSHKVLRWFTPHLFLALLALGLWLMVAGSTIWERGPGLLALGFLACGLLGFLLKGTNVRSGRPFRMVSYFISMQAALFMGFFRFCRGGLSGAWQRTERHTGSRGAGITPIL